MLLFIKAQHSFKLVIYLELSKSHSREKIVSFIYETLSAATQACPTYIPHTNWTHQSSTNFTTNDVIVTTNGQPREKAIRWQMVKGGYVLVAR